MSNDIFDKENRKRKYSSQIDVAWKRKRFFSKHITTALSGRQISERGYDPEMNYHIKRFRVHGQMEKWLIRVPIFIDLKGPKTESKSISF
ncbi:hypothetical protein CDAR_67871 [Caerostris darwini]|uniref:Uncharacterized protein n=1 Tax=Caerostris darwini TaxID=1538125 RepID=A0AAV4VUT0_9ARAC|nr:hypothetical protein CDAR_67871 [Caerostris darwini]